MIHRTSRQDCSASNPHYHRRLDQTVALRCSSSSFCHNNQHIGRAPKLDQTAARSTCSPCPHSKQHLAYYGYKMDIFSLGVLSVQICTRKYPKPTPSFRRARMEDPERGELERVTEVLRRHSHLQLMGRSHPLLPLARNCLRDKETDRPSAQQLCKDIGSVINQQSYV